MSAAIDMTQPGAFAKAFKCSVDPSNLDKSCCANHDFYQFANGNWLATNPIPDIYPAWGSFLMLRDENEERCKQIITADKWTPRDTGTTAHTTKLFSHCKTFYDAAMDEEAIEAASDTPIQPFIEDIDNLTTLTSAVANLHAKVGVRSLFSYGSSIDKKNSNNTIACFGQGGLGLPDRDYYFDEDKEDKRVAYTKHIGAMFTLLGLPDATAAASAVFEFEKRIAETHMTKSERRDVQKTYNVVTIADLTEYCGEVNWTEYLRGVHGLESDADVESKVGKINLSTVEAIKGLGKVLKDTEMDVLKSYMKWHVVNGFANDLSSPFVNEHFDFFSKELAGTKELKPRWKRAMGMLEGNLGEALGQLYVDQHFSGDAKPMALGIVESVRDALKERLAEVEWMSDSTRKAAMEKMEGFRVQIGFTDEWPGFAFFEGKLSGAHLQNIVLGHQFEYGRDIAEINKPTDKNKWYMTPQTVNAYYHPSMNLICFPAAILQPPFFDPNADLAVNYGAMGAVVGHEMTHGFDDQGSQYDAAGNMENWWTEDDKKDYESRVDVMIQQAEQHEVLGIKLKGKLTAGENLADLGGLRLSLRALEKRIGKDKLMSEDEKIDGFTPLQRFFLSWATVWRQNIKDERAKQLVTLDPHGPNDFRANGPLRNMPEFYKAFDVKESDPMFKPESERVDVW